MKKIFISYFLLFTIPAFASWYAVQETEDSIIHIDPETLKKDGFYRKMWHYEERKVIGEFKDKSVRLLKEYDCKNYKLRVLSFTMFPESNLMGRTIMSVDTPSIWIDLAPGTPSFNIAKLICR
jgi:hypothetical protein